MATEWKDYNVEDLPPVPPLGPKHIVWWFNDGQSRRRLFPGDPWDLQFAKALSGAFDEPVLPDLIAARAAFVRGWNSVTQPASEAIASADAPTPLTDAELDDICQRWLTDKYDDFYTIPDTVQALEDLKILIAEVQRLRANDDGAVTKGTVE